MNEGEKHFGIYSLSEIQNYLKGKLSAAKMHEMEVAALNDPFLADAIEGFELNSEGQPSSSNEQEIKKLRSRLEERISGKNKKVFILKNPMVWKVAASLILTLSLVALADNLLNNKKEKPRLAATLPSVHTDTVAMQSSSTEKIKAPDPNLRDKSMHQQEQRTPLKKESEITVKKPKRIPSTVFKSEESEMIADSTPAISKAEGEANANRINKSLEGKVAGVAVPSREEVKVTAYGTTKRSKMNIAPVSTKESENLSEPVNVVPVIGWEAYKKYIDENNTDSLNNSGKQVIVVFEVDKKGRLSNFRIEKSVSPSRDEEAIRRIKEGPAWKSFNRKKEKVRLAIHFND